MTPQSIYLITTLFLVFASAILGGLVAHKLKQPAIIGYIASGVLFGNLFVRGIDHATISTIADVGVTLLLFTIGLEFSFHRLRRVMGSVVWAACAQLLLVIVVFFGLYSFFGFGFLPSLFIGVAAGLSSTVIIVKVLSERGEMETIPGELSTAWSVIQDLAVIPVMILLPTLVVVTRSPVVTFWGVVGALALSIGKSIISIAIVIYLGRKGIPRLLTLIAGVNNREIFLLFTIGIVFLSALITYSFGLSAALGAFIAGLLLSETSQNHAIFSEIRPLRDIFAVVFFVSLGMVLPAASVLRLLPTLLVGSVAIMLFKWIIVFGFCRYMGNHRKTAFLVAVSLMQMSEFGFIIAREGLDLQVFNNEGYVFMVALTFITMFFGTTLLSFGHNLYYWFYKSIGKVLPKVFDTVKELPSPEELTIRDHIVICGYGRVGKYIGRALEMANIPYIVVDYNHTTIADLRSKGVAVLYGDPADLGVLDYAQVEYAKAVVIAIPDRHTQEMIIANCLTLNKHIHIICRTHHEEDQPRLKSLGVTTIVQPEFEAALSVINKLYTQFKVTDEDSAGKISRLKIEHGLG